MLVDKRITRNLITIPPDVSIAEAIEWMRREKVRRFPVVDKIREVDRDRYPRGSASRLAVFCHVPEYVGG